MDGIVFLACRCGYEEKTENSNNVLSNSILKKKMALESNLIVVAEEDKISIHPKTSKYCPKCDYKEAEAWQEQTRSADEPSTSFFRCLKCKYTWREY